MGERWEGAVGKWVVGGWVLDRQNEEPLWHGGGEGMWYR